MVPPPARAFALPAHLVRKVDPALIAHDEEHLAAVGASLRAQVADVSARLDAARREAGTGGQAALPQMMSTRCW